MWKCLDFSPVYANGKAIGVETSAVGPKKDAYTPDVGFMNDSSLRYDYGKYYTSKTFFDDVTKRRILLDWANKSSSVQDDIEKGWSSRCRAIHHLRNIEKFEASWTDPQFLCSQKGTSVKGGLGPFGLLTLASKNLEEYIAVFFRVFKANHNNFGILMCSDQSR
ncbi:Beta-fructofuranosidase insoluble isoenzyme CWINV1 [Bienertia sinuspersici]